MSALATRVSAALRKAELPVLRYSDRIGMRGRSGIRVHGGSGDCHVSFSVWVDEISHAKDEAVEWELSDRAMAVLIASGFDVSRIPGINLLTVQNRVRESGAVEDVQAITAASGLDISQPAPNEWHVEVGGQRGAYAIRRKGSGDRIRYAVDARKSGELAKNLRTMSAAIEAVKKELEKSA